MNYNGKFRKKSKKGGGDSFSPPTTAVGGSEVAGHNYIILAFFTCQLSMFWGTSPIVVLQIKSVNMHNQTYIIILFYW